jgi:hypothetical protein
MSKWFGFSVICAIVLMVGLSASAATLTPGTDANSLSIGPIPPPNPWEGKVSIGPWPPPNPWDDKAFIGPWPPPNPWDDKAFIGPWPPPNPWDDK